MTKEEFIARCENAYDCGLVTPKAMKLMEAWLDAMMRLEHSLFSYGQTQASYVWSFLEGERERLQKNGGQTLAGDSEGYDLIQFAAILGHTCQKCAVDPRAWWTRSAFCPHKEEISDE